MTVKKDRNNIILSAEPNKVIIAEVKNQKACKNYANCISGAFQYQNKANAILICGGKVISNLSAHGWLGYPDTCLIYYKDGTLAVKRLVSIPASELPLIEWAISGVGLLDMYKPAAEGYCRITKNGKTYNYSDVLRRTNHTAIGVKSGKVYGFYLSSMTGAEVNTYMKKQDMDFAVMLDGGHIAAVNCTQAQKNANQKQHNIIQFVQTEETTKKEDDTMKICIDAGHGGTDPGAVGQNGTKEKDVNLQIALKLQEALERNGITVVMTRKQDVAKKLTIDERCIIANSADVDYLISIHANADSDRDDRTGHGTETYAYSKTSKGYQLAQAIQKELIDANGLTDRGVKVKQWDILKGAKAPAVLVETAFLNNSAEEKLLTDAAFQKLTAEAIVKGIVQHIGEMWVPAAEPEYNLQIEEAETGEMIRCQITQENRNGTIWAPVREVAEALGCKVEWNGKYVVIYK